MPVRSFRAALSILVLAPCLLLAQENAPPAGRGGSGGRGARGGAQATREFLGLGPAPDAAAAKKGEPLYQQNCGGCHGADARGAQGPNLLRSAVVLHDEKGEAIGALVRSGRPQAGMPAYPNLSADELYNLAEYLHLQVELTANRGTYGATYAGLRNEVSGDARKGEAYFDGAGGCRGCHSATGDLAHIGTRFPEASTLQARILWPASPAPPRARITTSSGETYEATIRTLNDFDLSFTDAAGNYRYARRADVKIEYDRSLAGHRALLGKYTDDDIHNLTAYLVTLK
jgi:mono/diheme cytochrome c family protein